MIPDHEVANVSCTANVPPMLQTHSPVALDGSLHVATAAHGLAAHSLVAGTHWPPELTKPLLHVQVLGVPSAHAEEFAPHEFPVPVQLPFVHTSVVVQAWPSSQAVLLAFGDLPQVPPAHTPRLHAS